MVYEGAEWGVYISVEEAGLAPKLCTSPNPMRAPSHPYRSLVHLLHWLRRLARCDSRQGYYMVPSRQRINFGFPSISSVTGRGGKVRMTEDACREAGLHLGTE